MQYLRVILTYALTIYLVLLIGRMIFGWVQVFAREWRPKGIVLVLAEAIYTVTDPPLKFLRRFIPPLRIGMVAMDLSFMVLFIVVLILLEVAVPHLRLRYRRA
ncbi:MAG TPA: YggT family protein [Streptosporangiaceae bacterium]|nr:YggT family protein [Streptosporangiaceae bacterium]